MNLEWWHFLIGFIFFFMLFGKSKGGIVVKKLIADMEVLDDRFKDCRPDVDFSIFKEGKPVHIEFEVENLPLDQGEELEYQLNGEVFVTVKVKRNKEAEFDHWSDEDIYFPMVNEGDVLIIKYQGKDILKGIFNTILKPH